MPRFNKSLEPQNVMKEVSQEAKGSKIIPLNALNALKML